MRLPWYDSPTTYHVGLSHRGSRRINGKLTASKCFAFSVANLRFRGGFMWFVFVVFGIWRQDESWGTR